MPSKSKYPIVVETTYSVSIKYDFLDVPGADYDYRERFETKIRHACWDVNREFGVSNPHGAYRPHGNFYYKVVDIAGADPEEVRSAAQAVAKAIFAHRYVIPRLQ